LELFDVGHETVLTVRRVEQANTAIAMSRGSSEAHATSSHYTFIGGISPKQASELVVLRDATKVDVAQLDVEIARWQAIEPSLITAAQIQDLSERRESFRRRIEWIDSQLKLTPPPEQGDSN
jgi:hypothetical protein